MKEDYTKQRNDFRCEMPWQLTAASDKELKDVYNIMKRCWDIIPENRPKFYHLQVDVDYFQMIGDLFGYDMVPLGTDEPDGSDGHNHSSVALARTFSERKENKPISSLIN